VITERHPPASTPSAAPPRIRSVGSPHGSRGETAPAARRAKGTGDHVRFLLLSGKPLGEPIARYGPFVMNTQKEIEQALEDLRKGTFVWRG